MHRITGTPAWLFPAPPHPESRARDKGLVLEGDPEGRAWDLGEQSREDETLTAGRVLGITAPGIRSSSHFRELYRMSSLSPRQESLCKHWGSAAPIPSR